jgi:hypothetical protein
VGEVDEQGDATDGVWLIDSGRKLSRTDTHVEDHVAWMSCFVDEIYRAPRSWAEQPYPKLVHYSLHDRGGHFASWEQPQLLSEDLRATFRSLR